MAMIELLYQKFYRQLYLYALTFVGDEDEAKDTVSEVFADICKTWSTGGADSHRQPSASFLYKSTRNRCLDRLRRRLLAGAV